MDSRYLSQHIQAMFAVSTQTVRNWAGEFHAHLSPGANPGTGHNRTFTQDDLKVFALVSQLKHEGYVYADIHKELERGNRGTPPAIPDDLLPIATTETGLLIIAKMEVFERRLSELEVKIANSRNEYIEAELKEARDEIKRLNREIGQLEARLDMGHKKE